ncbi:SDR family oxidoreductase [Massilia sp. MB5]|uniref:SDR family oxidoreductase n=1 Tax=unclassified Massilia TaxID=2609279 RepID=UPI00067CDADF|nr:MULTISPECIES: SDR family oxidoreductase [unclassified Massilia]AKU24353.1 short-chain dehydrogenase [Massilia sp. NR 4-1]UMR30647.1 SDR family oxidoreductase [Massilia sp. MB5]
MNAKEQNGRKVAFVTGANRGIGFGTALELGRQGIHVILGARDEASGRKALAELGEQDVQAEWLEFDVANAADHQRAYDFIEQKYGKLDILVNNAGIMLETPETEFNQKNTTSVVSGDALRGTFEVNFFGLVGLTQTLLPLIKRAPAGRIVNVSSVLASLNIHATSDDPRLPNHRQFAYNASKTAVNAFTIHLAKELAGSSIKVNAAHPGWVRTDMGGPHAEMSIEEGAATSVQLALLGDDGPSGSYMHRGQVLPW